MTDKYEVQIGKDGQFYSKSYMTVKLPCMIDESKQKVKKTYKLPDDDGSEEVNDLVKSATKF